MTESRLNSVLTEDLRIVNQLGRHARPAAALVQTVLKFQCDVHVSLNGHRINGSAALQAGDVIRVGTPGVELRMIFVE